MTQTVIIAEKVVRRGRRLSLLPERNCEIKRHLISDSIIAEEYKAGFYKILSDNIIAGMDSIIAQANIIFQQASGFYLRRSFPREEQSIQFSSKESFYEHEETSVFIPDIEQEARRRFLRRKQTLRNSKAVAQKEHESVYCLAQIKSSSFYSRKRFLLWEWTHPIATKDTVRKQGEQELLDQGGVLSICDLACTCMLSLASHSYRACRKLNMA